MRPLHIIGLLSSLGLFACGDEAPASRWPDDPSFRVGFARVDLTPAGFERYVDDNGDGHIQRKAYTDKDGVMHRAEPFIDSGRDGKLDFEEQGALGADGKPGKAGVDDDGDGCMDDLLGCSPADDPANPCSAACEYAASGSDDVADPAKDNHSAANPTGTEQDGKWQGAIIAGYGGALTDDDLRPAQGVHDPIWARAVVFSQGKDVLAIVSVDFAGFLHLYGNPVKRAIAAQTGIPYENIIYSATHNHEAPDVVGIWAGPSELDYVYLEEVQNKMAQAVADAVAALRPATLTSATAELDGCYDAQRRFKKGSACRFPPGLSELQANPTAWDTPVNQIDLRDPMVYNHKVSALVARDVATGEVLGTVVNFHDHPEVLGSSNNMISSDFPHYARVRLEQRLGGVAVYVSGTTGSQIGTLRGTRVPLRDEAGEPVYDPAVTDADGKPFPRFAGDDQPDPRSPNIDKIRSQGFLLADAAVEALLAATPTPDPRVAVSASDLDVPMSNPTLGLGLLLLESEARKHGYPKDPGDDRVHEKWCPDVTGEPTCFRVSMVVASVGEVTFLTSPGEPAPEYLHGRPASTVDYGAPYGAYAFPAMPALRPHIKTREVMMLDIANGYFGYLVPESDYLTDGDHPNYYEELPSAGARFGDTVGNKLLRMLGAPADVTFNAMAEPKP